MPHTRFEKVYFNNHLVGELTYDNGDIYATPRRSKEGSFKVKSRLDGVDLCIYYYKVLIPMRDNLKHWIKE